MFFFFFFFLIETNSVVVTDLPLVFYITEQLEHLIQVIDLVQFMDYGIIQDYNITNIISNRLFHTSTSTTLHDLIRDTHLTYYITSYYYDCTFHEDMVDHYIYYIISFLISFLNIILFSER